MKEHSESYYYNMTDAELVREVQTQHPENFLAVMLASRLETQLEVNEQLEGLDDGDDTGR